VDDIFCIEIIHRAYSSWNSDDQEENKKSNFKNGLFFKKTK